MSALGAALAGLLAAALSSCGGSGPFDEPGLTLEQAQVECSADPGVACEARLTARPPQGAASASLLWEEQPASAGTPVVRDVSRNLQPDGSWQVAVLFRNDRPAGTYSGSIDLNLADLFADRPTATLAYTFTANGAQGTLTALRALPGGGDWATFGGSSAHTGAVAATLDVARFSRRWTLGGAETGVLSAVVTTAGRVYAGSLPPGEAVSRLWAFNELDGSLAWSFDDAARFDPPATGSGLVYLSNTGMLSAVDAATGALRYARAHPVPQAGALTTGLLAPTPHADAVYAGNGDEGELVSHDAVSGTAEWRAPLRESLDPLFQNWSPAVGGDLVFSNVFGIFSAFGRDDGVKRFSVAVPGPTGGSPLTVHALNQAPVVVDAGSVLLLDRRSVYPNPVANTLTMIDLPTRGVRWSAQGQFTTQPVAAPGLVYVGNHASQQLEARDAATGSVLWAWQPDGEAVTAFKDLLVTNNLLFVAAGDTTHAVDLATRQAVWSYPAAGALALSSQGVLYIVTTSDGVAPNWLIAINLH